MYAEYNNWSVTLYAEDHKGDLDKLRALAAYATQCGVSFGSVQVIPLPATVIALQQKEAGSERGYVPTPYVWFPHKEFSEIVPLLKAANIDTPDGFLREVVVEEK